jgi:hypothetical protein
MLTRKKIVLASVLIGFVLLMLSRQLEVRVANAAASSQKTLILKPASTALVPVRVASSQVKQPVDAPSAPPNFQAPLTDEQRRALCKLKAAHSRVPMNGEIEVFTSSMTDESKTNFAWIRSPDCADGLYSILHFSDDGDIQKEIDCRQTDLTELMVFSGHQADVLDVMSTDSEFNMALSGSGYFALRCPDSSLLLTRDGKFIRGDNGQLVNENGCALIDSEGNLFEGHDVDAQGCTPEGRCVGTLDPAFDAIEGLRSANSYSFTAISAIFPEASATKSGPNHLRTKLFVDALEDVKNPERGATSVSWSDALKVNLADLKCENE